MTMKLANEVTRATLRRLRKYSKAAMKEQAKRLGAAQNLLEAMRRPWTIKMNPLPAKKE